MHKNWLSALKKTGRGDTACRNGGEEETGAILVRRHFLFSGRVQFVGFRYRSLYLAEASGITGWVRNLDDGRVEMEAQGTAEKLAFFRKGLYELPGVLIEDCLEEERETVPSEKAYRVRG